MLRRARRLEDGTDPNRWMISYADMITLLFVVFVILYAQSEVNVRKAEQLRRSLAFALNTAGKGKTYHDGLHERGDVGGDLLEDALLLTAQKGPMMEFLRQSLPREFEEITGRSIKLDVTNDTVSFSAPLGAFFMPGSRRLRPEVRPWLSELVAQSYKFASNIRIHVAGPRLRIATRTDGSPLEARHLCLERLAHLQDLVGWTSTVMHDHVTTQFAYTGAPSTVEQWEDDAVLTLYFANSGA